MLFLAQGERRFHMVSLGRPDDAFEAFDGRLFPCLILDSAGDWPPEERSRLARRLIAMGCRYAVCAGETCAQWEHEVDSAFIDLELTETQRQDRFVMTTSHADETLDDVAFFFVYQTNFNQHAFDDLLVLQLGNDPAIATQLQALVKSHASG